MAYITFWCRLLNTGLLWCTCHRQKPCRLFPSPRNIVMLNILQRWAFPLLLFCFCGTFISCTFSNKSSPSAFPSAGKHTEVVHTVERIWHGPKKCWRHYYKREKKGGKRRKSSEVKWWGRKKYSGNEKKSSPLIETWWWVGYFDTLLLQLCLWISFSLRGVQIEEEERRYFLRGTFPVPPILPFT